jgi:hypothetical protein
MRCGSASSGSAIPAPSVSTRSPLNAQTGADLIDDVARVERDLGAAAVAPMRSA